jgi:hypothetical protein
VSAKAKDKDLFDDSVETEEVVTERNDLEEGFLAESDPLSKMKDPLGLQKGPGEDVINESLNKQVTALGRETAKKLNELPKHKVVIPYKELNPDDHFVVVGTNGWNMQIKRGVPVMLPDEIIKRLGESGEAPTLVR